MENRGALHHHVLSLSSHICFSLPSQLQGSGGANLCCSPSPSTAFTQTPSATAFTECREAPGAPAGEGSRGTGRKMLPPHTMSHCWGRWRRCCRAGQPQRQTQEAAWGEAKGSCYRELCAHDLWLQCLKSPSCARLQSGLGLQSEALVAEGPHPPEDLVRSEPAP